MRVCVCAYPYIYILLPVSTCCDGELDWCCVFWRGQDLLALALLVFFAAFDGDLHTIIPLWMGLRFFDFCLVLSCFDLDLLTVVSCLGGGVNSKDCDAVCAVWE